MKTAAGKFYRIPPQSLESADERILSRTSAARYHLPDRPQILPDGSRRGCRVSSWACSVTEYRTRRVDTPAPDLEQQMLATTPAEQLRQAAAENYDDILYN